MFLDVPHFPDVALISALDDCFFKSIEAITVSDPPLYIYKENVMPTKIIMPQLGESVVEGTVIRWLVAEGDRVDEFDPILEVTTDKVCELMAGELVVDKNTSSAFHTTPIDLYLRNMGVETIVLTGVAADMCVFATALDAADRGFHVISTTTN